MWLPTLLKAVEGDMRTEGLQLSADDIYSINQGSLKDAVALFGGGCTAEVVSTKGLIFTNHHCGHGAIQAHSTLAHNYLRDGFMATTLADELPNPGLSVTFIERMEDVTRRMSAVVRDGMNEQQREDAQRTEGAKIIREVADTSRWDAVVKPFNYGNSWFLILSRTFRDIRLVAAPPSGIGEFGGDADNWMWPRHTGDFSVFRIYAAPDGTPAPFAHDNIPFTPRRSLVIDRAGAREGEFAMVYGFPGSTEYFIPARAVKDLVEVTDPVRIAMRTASLAVIDAAMAGDPGLKIQYAGMQRRIANGWKKWQGEVQGLDQLDALGLKRAEEAEFRKRAAGLPEYQGIVDRMDGTYAKLAPFAKAREVYAEFNRNGAVLPRFAAGFSKLADPRRDWPRTERDQEITRLKALARAFFRNNNMEVDRGMFAAQLPIALREQVPAMAPPQFLEAERQYHGDAHRLANDLYARSIFSDSVKLLALLDHFTPKAAKRLAKDPAFRWGTDANTAYDRFVAPRFAAISDSLQADLRLWTKGLIDLFPEKNRWPDANLTLRLSYGRVEGAMPRDGVLYTPFTTLDGVMAKNDPSDPEFTVPQKLIDLYKAKDFGPYAINGVMRTCFLASLHTTGGNSGSPVLNGEGRLIGINFDRTWESTMSDILFDPGRCRNISVDINYVLFVIDKYLGGTRLIDEMELVGQAGPPHMISLPVHR